MRWWCSAQGTPWTWTWQPYIGVWLLGIALGALYVRWHRAASPSASPPARRWAAVGGIAALWLLLDWPIGALAAGYLESVHALQFLGLVFVVSPLLLFGLPAGWEARLGPRAARVLGGLTQPLYAIIWLNVIVIATHVPVLVDALMVTQAGSLAIDAAWIAGGLVFWWPVVRAWPVRLAAAGRLAYLLGGVTLHMGVGMFYVVANVPLYGVYELAPRVSGIDPLDDQGRAGGIMMAGDVAVGLGAIAILLYLWAREEARREEHG
jgi:cytochrome c oxidase assembly factor CtaG